MKTEINIALIELVISLAIGILTAYLTKLVLMRFYLKKTNEQNPYQNLSFMIFLSGTIFSISYIVFGIMEPLSSTIKLLSTRNTSVAQKRCPSKNCVTYALKLAKNRSMSRAYPCPLASRTCTFF